MHTFLRRLGPDPHEGGRKSAAANNCPDFFELDNGDLAVIGINISASAANLPASAGCGPDECIVRVPRDVVQRALADIATLA